ncbi:MAG: hypothetical protein U5N58_04945 [Actinomycetota bacterium]|nr:hypothetical protein [Actinomycetota bacterium]
MEGDTVNIDYTGSVDGQNFEGGSTEGMGTEVTHWGHQLYRGLPGAACWPQSG